MSNAGRALALSELRERIERLEHGRGQRPVRPGEGLKVMRPSSLSGKANRRQDWKTLSLGCH
jgi:hypothetical protein